MSAKWTFDKYHKIAKIVADLVDIDTVIKDFETWYYPKNQFTIQEMSIIRKSLRYEKDEIMLELKEEMKDIL